MGCIEVILQSLNFTYISSTAIEGQFFDCCNFLCIQIAHKAMKMKKITNSQWEKHFDVKNTKLDKLDWFVSIDLKFMNELKIFFELTAIVNSFLLLQENSHCGDVFLDFLKISTFYSTSQSASCKYWKSN